MSQQLTQLTTNSDVPFCPKPLNWAYFQENLPPTTTKK